MDVKIIHRPAFTVVGTKTWISGQDNEQFSRFWKECHERGIVKQLQHMMRESGNESGPQTGSTLLGLSRIENDHSNRAFYYMIAIEARGNAAQGRERTGSDLADSSFHGLEFFSIPQGLWAVFPCRGSVPESIMNAEIYAFTEWLPQSEYRHAGTVEMEVYPASSDEQYCEFWLQILPR